MPATFASASILSPAAVTIASMSVCWVMSPVTVTISASGKASRKEVSRSPVTSTAMTRPPSRAMRDAVARPIPEAAPVTITVLPVNRTGVSCSFRPVSGTSVGTTPPFAWRTRSSMTDWGS